MTNQLLKPLERWMKLAVIPPAGAGGDPAGRSGVGLVVTPDGPNGPRQVAKMDMIRLARASRLPIIPLAFSCSKKLFASWDRFMVPYPWSRGLFLWGPPLWVSPDGDAADLEATPGAGSALD